MTFSNRGNDRFRGTNYGKSSFGERSTARATMHDAVCAKCGAPCQVPFVPNGRKEVFCSKCFGEMNGGNREADSRSGYGSNKAPRMFDKRDSYSDRQMFRATCDECGSSCEVPFRPTNGKPVLCSNCFAEKNGESGAPRRTSNYPSAPVKSANIDLSEISSKLDKILKLLAPTNEAKEVAKEITSKILADIEETSGKKVETSKRKVKKVSKKAE